MKDYYYLLGLNENCTKDEIRKNFRKLSKALHPDKNENDDFFSARFKEINEAYEVLSDDYKKANYDKTRKGTDSKYKSISTEVKIPKTNKRKTKIVAIAILGIAALSALIIFILVQRVEELQNDNTNLNSQVNDWKRSKSNLDNRQDNNFTSEVLKSIKKAKASIERTEPKAKKVKSFQCSNCESFKVYFRNPKWREDHIDSNFELESISILNKSEFTIMELSIKWTIIDNQGIPIDTGEERLLHQDRISPGLARTVDIEYQSIPKKESSQSLIFEIVDFNKTEL